MYVPASRAVPILHRASEKPGVMPVPYWATYVQLLSNGSATRRHISSVCMYGVLFLYISDDQFALDTYVHMYSAIQKVSGMHKSVRRLYAAQA